MALGSYAFFDAPSLWAVMPLVIYIVLVLRNIPMFSSLIAAIFVGVIITGQSIGMAADMFVKSVSSPLAAIGVIALLGGGLGAVMTKTGVTKTLVYWIVKGIGINSQKKGIFVTAFCSMLMSALLGTMAGGNAILAPIIIPLVAQVGITPSVVSILFKVCGDTGLVWGPLSPPTVTILALTGLSYSQMMLWAGLPFGIVYMGGAIVGSMILLKKNRGPEVYEIDESSQKLDEVIVSKEEKRSTLLFIISFLAFIIYGMASKQGTNYVHVVIILTSLIIGFAGKLNIEQTFSTLLSGASKLLNMFFIFVFFDMMINLITVGGGWDALSEFMGGLLSGISKVGVVMLTAVVGIFGLEGAAVAELKLLHQMFYPLAVQVGLPVEIFIIALIASIRLTASVYPSGNLVTAMGIARSTDTKRVLFGTWIASGATILFIVIWALMGSALVEFFS